MTFLLREGLGWGVTDVVTASTAADLSGFRAETVRFYEDAGLVGAAARSASGYRLCSEGEVRGLRLIRRARILGLALADVKAFAGAPFRESCGELEERLQAVVELRLREIDLGLCDDESIGHNLTLQAYSSC